MSNDRFEIQFIYFRIEANIHFCVIFVFLIWFGSAHIVEDNQSTLITETTVASIKETFTSSTTPVPTKADTNSSTVNGKATVIPYYSDYLPG